MDSIVWLVTQSCPTLCNPMDRLLCPWDSPGKNTGVDSHSLLPGIFSNPVIEPGSPALQADSLLCELQGSPIYQYCFINYSERRSWHPVPSLHGKYMGKQLKECQTLFFWAPKSLQMVTAAMKLKDTYSLEGKL